MTQEPEEILITPTEDDDSPLPPEPGTVGDLELGHTDEWVVGEVSLDPPEDDQRIGDLEQAAHDDGDDIDEEDV